MGRTIRNPHDVNTQAFVDFEDQLADQAAQYLAECGYPDEVLDSGMVVVPKEST
jgi:hypothetical protein